jgi:hypothetical protein
LEWNYYFQCIPYMMKGKTENQQKTFFSTLNQYFPHISYVASKKCSTQFVTSSVRLWLLTFFWPFRPRFIFHTKFMLNHTSFVWFKSFHPVCLCSKSLLCWNKLVWETFVLQKQKFVLENLESHKMCVENN